MSTMGEPSYQTTIAKLLRNMMHDVGGGLSPTSLRAGARATGANAARRRFSLYITDYEP